MDRTSRTRLQQINEDRRALNAAAAHIRVLVSGAERVANEYREGGTSVYTDDMREARERLLLAFNGVDSAMARTAEREALISDAISEKP